MRTNGYLYYLKAYKPTVNDFGEVMESASEWSDAIPCNISKNTDNRKGVYQDGQFRSVSATVLVDREIDGMRGRIKLETYDDDLGEFDVLSVTEIPGMGRTEIKV